MMQAKRHSQVAPRARISCLFSALLAAIGLTGGACEGVASATQKRSFSSFGSYRIDAGVKDKNHHFMLGRQLGGAQTLAMHSTLYPIEEPFRLRPHGNHIEVVAGSRASIEVEVERHPSFDDPIEIQAIGFPPHVVGIVAITKDPSRILLVVEASDLAAPTESHPFTLEGHSNGVRWSQRLFVTIAPEQPPPKEDW